VVPRSQETPAYPLLFAGGKPEKVQETRAKFPMALYCGTDEVVEVLAELVRK
jgi:hypothetical protein